MARIPEHLVVSHILPWVYDTLAIDTRRHFGMQPRRLCCTDQHNVLLECFRKRNDDIYFDIYSDWNLLARPSDMIYESGFVPCIRACALHYDAKVVSLEIMWWQTTGKMSYTCKTTWFAYHESVATLEHHYNMTGECESIQLEID